MTGSFAHSLSLFHLFLEPGSHTIICVFHVCPQHKTRQGKKVRVKCKYAQVFTLQLLCHTYWDCMIHLIV